VLALSGDLDLRAPRLEASRIVAQFPHGHLLTVTNTGHSVLTAAATDCPLTAVRTWLSGKSIPRSCAAPRLIAPIATFPAAGKTRQPTAAGSVLPLVEKTVLEAEASYVMGSYEEMSGAVPGLAGGEVTLTRNGLRLVNYRTVLGVALSGELRTRVRLGNPLAFQGVLQVAHGGKTVGSLAVNADGLTGTLEGRTIVANRLSPVAVSSRSSARSARAWSGWTPSSGTPANVAKQIAQHVASEYRLDAAGARLVNVSDSPVHAPSGLRPGPVAAIAVDRPGEGYEVQVTSGTWSYTLCGTSSRCSLPGVATVTRGRLVRREALELALDTFRFAPAISSVVVYLPPPSGRTYGSQALYIPRSQLARELAHPLASTLPLATPPLPTEADGIEAARIDRLTDPDLFYAVAFPLFGTKDDLVLDPVHY